MEPQTTPIAAFAANTAQVTGRPVAQVEKTYRKTHRRRLRSVSRMRVTVGVGTIGGYFGILPVAGGTMVAAQNVIPSIIAVTVGVIAGITCYLAAHKLRLSIEPRTRREQELAQALQAGHVDSKVAKTVEKKLKRPRLPGRRQPMLAPGNTTRH